MRPAIHLDHVSKTYGQAQAVRDLDLTVEAGAVLGFLGPNGAGKTTTIRLLMGFLRPTAGTIHLLGHNMHEPAQARRVRRQIGFVPDVAGLDPTATGAQLLADLAVLQGEPAVDRDHLVETLELRPTDLRRPIGRLSRGTRQKINLVQGLQHRPDLIVLDEPTEALDPLAKRALFGLLQAAKARGATIFFSSHILSEVEELCDQVALIRGGRLVAVEQIATLRAQLARRVTLTLASADMPVGGQLATLPTVTNLAADGNTYRFSVAEISPFLALLPTLPISDLLVEPATLEELFLQYYSD
ncbi:MAG TPA: ABC transporter ATP-binding protein [Caldilineaceae bacterium]|nr:ABC transporter ATP-binding protein [Caldilineaceae bacterium]